MQGFVPSATSKVTKVSRPRRSYSLKKQNHQPITKRGQSSLPIHVSIKPLCTTSAVGNKNTFNGQNSLNSVSSNLTIQNQKNELEKEEVPTISFIESSEVETSSSNRNLLKTGHSTGSSEQHNDYSRDESAKTTSESESKRKLTSIVVNRISKRSKVADQPRRTELNQNQNQNRFENLQTIQTVNQNDLKNDRRRNSARKRKEKYFCIRCCQCSRLCIFASILAIILLSAAIAAIIIATLSKTSPTSTKTVLVTANTATPTPGTTTASTLPITITLITTTITPSITVTTTIPTTNITTISTTATTTALTTASTTATTTALTTPLTTDTTTALTTGTTTAAPTTATTTVLITASTTATTTALTTDTTTTVPTTATTAALTTVSTTATTMVLTTDTTTTVPTTATATVTTMVSTITMTTASSVSTTTTITPTATTTTATTTTITTTVTLTTSTTSVTATTTTKTTSTTSATTTTTTKTTSTTSVTISVGSWNTTGTALIGATQLNNQWGLIFDSSDTLYIADRLNHRILQWKVNATNATTVAGQANCTLGTNMYYLNEPTYIQLDSSGNIYIADMKNHRVQFWAKGATSGTTVAGTGVAGTSNNQLNQPYGIALDSNTGTLYIADYNNNRIMSYLSGASSGTVVAGGNGQGTGSTQLSLPVGVIFESPSNSLAIINSGSHNVARWILGGSTWTLVVGSPTGATGTSSTLLNTPEGAVFDPMGNLYVADRLNHRIQFFLSGKLNGSTVAGTTGVSGSTATLLNNPYGVALDSQLNLYVSDKGNSRILKYSRR